MRSTGWAQWSNLSFRLQLFLVLTTTTAIITIASTIFFSTREFRSSQRQLRNEGRILAVFLTRELQLPLYAGNNEEVSRHASALLENANIEGVRVRNGKGELVADVRRTTTVWEDEPPTVSAEVVTTNSSFSPEAQLLGEQSAEKQLIGTVELALNTVSITERMQQFVKIASIIAIMFWLSASAIGFLVLRHMTRTISLMLEGVERIAGGDLDTSIVATSSADAVRAATAINAMATALKQRQEENHRLQMEKLNSLRLELDEEKTRHMAKLIQTNRMTSLGLLVSSMAHEINNPNGTMRMAGEFLAKTWKDTEPLLAELADSEGDFSVGGMRFSMAREEIQRAIDSIARNSDRIERVVQNLRSYSLGDRKEFRNDVDMNRVAANALAIVRAHSRQADVNIATMFDRDLPKICGNPFQLEQVITNLLLNAIQALPAEGSRRVFLTTERQPHNGSITVEVRDEGHGIPAEYLPHLCEPFFSTRIDTGGSGLGLYIANFIVTEHRGRLEFTSKQGSGSTVTIHLPANPPEPASGITPPPLLQQGPASC